MLAAVCSALSFFLTRPPFNLSHTLRPLSLEHRSPLRERARARAPVLEINIHVIRVHTVCVSIHVKEKPRTQRVTVFDDDVDKYRAIFFVLFLPDCWKYYFCVRYKPRVFTRDAYCGESTAVLASVLKSQIFI